MRLSVLSLTLLLALALNILCVDVASFKLSRITRQASDQAEQESPPPQAALEKNKDAPQVTRTGQAQQTGRLYPDLPRPANFVPPFNNVGPPNFAAPPVSHHHGQTPFVPFGVPMPTSRLNADQQPTPFGRVLPQPKVSTPAERLQSQTFANGLGARLLAMIGIEPNSTSSSGAEQTAPGHQQQPNEAARALQNSTVLQQLNRGVASIYGGLSKMYNSTVQQQLDLLQRRLRTETQNSTNPWHQRMVEQVPEFFKQMAARVGQAQDQLNKVMYDVTQAAQGNSSMLNSRSSTGGANQRPSLFSSIEQFMAPAQADGNFFDNIGHSLGFGAGPQQASMVAAADGSQQQQQQQQQQQRDIAAQLREFWHTQVQPQIGMVQNQVMRAWRDLTASGAFTPETAARSRSILRNGARNESGSNLVDDVLKEVEMAGSEYTLIEPKNGEQTPAANETPGIKLSPQMQNRLIAMQRELNTLWMGLTNSLQGAINNVRNAIDGPRARFANMPPSTNQDNSSDPAVSEVNGKVNDLTKLQHDADTLYAAIREQQRETQQRQTFGDRFRNFFNSFNVDMSAVNQLPDRIGQQFNRFGVAVGDMLNQLPDRWDNFAQSIRQSQAGSGQTMKLSTSTSTSTTENPKIER